MAGGVKRGESPRNSSGALCGVEVSPKKYPSSRGVRPVGVGSVMLLTQSSFAGSLKLAQCHESTLSHGVVNVNQRDWCGESLHVCNIWSFRAVCSQWASVQGT